MFAGSCATTEVLKNQDFVKVVIQQNNAMAVEDAFVALLWQSVWTTQLESNFVRYRFTTDNTRMNVSSRTSFVRQKKRGMGRRR